jgi:FemAB-related protein (PEP-CTERM system-associated)
MAGAVRVSTVSRDAIDAQLWDEYANRVAGGTAYHLYGWRHVIESTFEHKTCYIAARSDSGSVIGILPLAQLKSRAFGNMLVSLPFFNYGGICADSAEVRDALLEAAIRMAADEKVDFLELRHDEDWCQGLPKKTSKVTMRLALPPSSDDLWKSFPSKLRSQIQKARKEGLTALVGREEQLDAFYDVFSANMRDLGTPVYSKSFFRNILHRFPEQTWISTVYLREQPIASGFLVGFKDRLEIPWASAARAFNRLNPNMLLYWSCLEFACRSGYGVFDFGRSTPGEGTFRFKQQWGAQPIPLFWSYWIRNGGAIPQVNPKNPKYRMAIAIWRQLPLGITRGLGPRIVKYIP